MVTVLDADWAIATLTGVTVRAGEPRRDLDLRLVPGTVVTGRVTAGPGGRPAPEEAIYLEQQGLYRWAWTDADGRYRLRVGPGEFRLAGPDMQYANLKVQTEATITRDFDRPRRPRGPFTLTVRLADGTPAVGAMVQCARDARTDAQGQVRWMRNLEPLLPYARDATGSSAAFVALGADADSADLTLRPAATATGRVVGPDGRPRVNYSVCCIVRGAADAAPQQYVRLSACTGSDGTFTLPGLATGAICQLTICNGMTWGIQPSKEFTVAAAGTLALGDIPLPPDLK
jgi:hypothetical protein